MSVSGVHNKLAHQEHMEGNNSTQMQILCLDSSAWQSVNTTQSSEKELVMQSYLPPCSCIHETTTHILTECNYIEALWNIVASRFSLNTYSQMSQYGGPK
jgi:hypothetical protein